MMENGTQSTVVNYDLFAELTVYCWQTQTVTRKAFFFVAPFEDDCISDKSHYWNCGSIDTAVELAKHDAENRGCTELAILRQDVTRSSCYTETKEKKS